MREYADKDYFNEIRAGIVEMNNFMWLRMLVLAIGCLCSVAYLSNTHALFVAVIGLALNSLFLEWNTNRILHGTTYDALRLSNSVCELEHLTEAIREDLHRLQRNS
ncbi:hypothetical protein [uncultured Cohaesibacter sp.]|uniref:hypothetical protein n=1 Tax=uncultured Cohaesibacter sp. TaxID=1002546 RepID=UPI002AAAAAC7|nr:hypothetical protein [uncultured Cohaesibacter sp.]